MQLPHFRRFALLVVDLASLEESGFQRPPARGKKGLYGQSHSLVERVKNNHKSNKCFYILPKSIASCPDSGLFTGSEAGGLIILLSYYAAIIYSYFFSRACAEARGNTSSLIFREMPPERVGAFTGASIGRTLMLVTPESPD